MGENRRVANLLRGEGTDILLFGYTVQEDDEDADGIRVEAGSLSSRVTGFYFNKDTGDIGLWPSSSSTDVMNRFYNGLGDDPDHVVVRLPAEEPVDDEPPIVPPIDNTITPPHSHA